MFYLKQSTATQIVLLGPFLDEDDGKTSEGGLTIANTDIRISKNGGNMEDKNSGGGTHDEAGWYTATFDATDTSAVGRLQVSIHVSGALPVWMEFQVLEEVIFDALFAASAAAFDANQRVDVGSWVSTAVTLSATSTKPEVDVNSISDDAAAANNMELDYDGTGFDKANSEIGTVAVNTDMVGTDGVDTATMRGTDSAALAVVLGALADGASDGDPTAVDTLMQYIKQLINILMGTAGIVAYPAGAAPGNGVSLAEVVRQNFDDIAALNDLSQADILDDATPFSGGDIDAAITSRLAPTVAARTLDVAATGEAGVDFNNILGTLDAAEIGAAALTAAKFATDAIDANALAADAVDEIRDALLPTQNATFDNIMFLLVAASDHVTPVTGATGLAVTRSIDGAAFGAGTGTLAEVANGIYQYDASAADMNGGIITFRFTASGGTPGAADDRFITIVTGGGV